MSLGSAALAATAIADQQRLVTSKKTPPGRILIAQADETLTPEQR